jgi:hypothetical protein
MFHMSVAVISLRKPFISESPPTPLEMMAKISPSLDPNIHSASVRLGGLGFFGASGPSPSPLGPCGLNWILDRSRLRIAPLGRLSHDRRVRQHEPEGDDGDRSDEVVQGLRSATHSTSNPAGRIQPYTTASSAVEPRSLMHPTVPALGRATLSKADARPDIYGMARNSLE